MAAPNIGELVALTLRHRDGELRDNFTNHNATLRVLNEKGHIKPVSGGRTIVEELEYAANSTVAWYQGYESLDTTPSTVFDAAEYDWAQLAGTISISGLEGLQNSGSKETVINLLESRIGNLKRSLTNTMATSLFSTGTNSKEINGIPVIVDTTPSTGTVGGIDASVSTNAFWRNQATSIGSFAASTQQADMNAMWLLLLRGADKPDLIIGDSNSYTAFEENLQDRARYTDASKSKAVEGFETLMYKTAKVIYDDQCTTNRMFFLNTDYIYLRPHKDRQFIALDRRESINQDASVIPIVWAGQLTCSNRALQGVLYP